VAVGHLVRLGMIALGSQIVLLVLRLLEAMLFVPLVVECLATTTNNAMVP